VDDATSEDNSVCTISHATMEKLGLFRGDTVLLKGKKRRESPLVVLSEEGMEDNKIKLNKGKKDGGNTRVEMRGKSIAKVNNIWGKCLQ